eukprot:1470141-Rhodomonas_salina.1
MVQADTGPEENLYEDGKQYWCEKHESEIRTVDSTSTMSNRQSGAEIVCEYAMSCIEIGRRLPEQLQDLPLPLHGPGLSRVSGLGSRVQGLGSRV